MIKLNKKKENYLEILLPYINSVCENYVLVGIYSRKLYQSFFKLSSPLREKIPYIIDLNYGGKEEIDSNLKIFKYVLTPQEYKSSDTYSEVFRGSIGVVDVYEKNYSDIITVLKTFNTFSVILLFNSSGGIVPTIKDLPPGWKSCEMLDTPNKKIKFAMIKNKNVECGSAIFSMKDAFDELDEESPLLISPKKRNSSQKIESPESVKSISPSPTRNISPTKNLYSDEYSPEIFAASLKNYPHPFQRGAEAPFTEEWYLSLKMYLKSLFDIYFDAELLSGGILDKLLSDENIKTTFTKMLVCPVYDLDPRKNYDQLEAIGDAILKFCFKNYILRKLPLVEDKELSELLSRYMSVEFQPLLGKVLELDKWVIVDELTTKIPNKIVEDVLESWCGAIASAAESLTSLPGLGVNLIQSFINKVWDSSGLNLSLTFGTNKTLIDQLEKRYGLDQGSGKPIVSVESDGNRTVRYNITGKNFKLWVEDMLLISGLTQEEILKIKIPTGLHTKKTARSQKAAESAAADDIVLQLEKLGITREMMITKDIRLSSMYRNKDYRKVIDKCIEKIMGLYPTTSRVYIDRPKENQLVDTSVAYIVRVDFDGSLSKLFGMSFTPKGKGKEDDITLLEKYVI